jgi:hypothetical protein
MSSLWDVADTEEHRRKGIAPKEIRGLQSYLLGMGLRAT